MKRKNVAVINLSEPDKPKLDFLSKKSVLRDLSEFPDKKKVMVTIETLYRQRTTEQNSTLHWYLNEISEECGMDMEAVKKQMAKKFLTVPELDKKGEQWVDPETGELATRVRSTTELTTVEFNEYTDKIRLWALDYLNCYLPLPNEPVELKFDL